MDTWVYMFTTLWGCSWVYGWKLTFIDWIRILSLLSLIYLIKTRDFPKASCIMSKNYEINCVLRKEKASKAFITLSDNQRHCVWGRKKQPYHIDCYSEIFHLPCYCIVWWSSWSVFSNLHFFFSEYESEIRELPPVPW